METYKSVPRRRRSGNLLVKEMIITVKLRGLNMLNNIIKGDTDQRDNLLSNC